MKNNLTNSFHLSGKKWLLILLANIIATVV